MNNYKIKYIRKIDKEKIDDEAVYRIIDEYFGCLYNNGQIIGGYDIFLKDDVFCVTFLMPEGDALSRKNNSEYAKVSLEKLEDIFESELIIEGENFEYREQCICEKPSWFFLCTEHFQNSSPLICGDCDNPVPLYKVPHILGEKEHFSVITSWQQSHKNMHSLWINGNWDRFTYSQLSKFNSKLNKEGQKICKEFEKVLGAPVYNYIYVWSENEYSIVPKGMIREIPEVCPKCGEEWTYCGQWTRNMDMLKWLGKEKTKNFKSQFAFCKCDNCRLVMDNPDWTENEE